MRLGIPRYPKVAPRIAQQHDAVVAMLTGGTQLGLFDAQERPIERELKSIDIDSTTSMEAQEELKRLQDLL